MWVEGDTKDPVFTVRGAERVSNPTGNGIACSVESFDGVQVMCTGRGYQGSLVHRPRGLAGIPPKQTSAVSVSSAQDASLAPCTVSKGSSVFPKADSRNLCDVPPSAGIT